MMAASSETRGGTLPAGTRWREDRSLAAIECLDRSETKESPPGIIISPHQISSKSQRFLYLFPLAPLGEIKEMVAEERNVGLP